ncbi:MAG: ABC transporter permease, partial [Acidobacteriota bacterium]
REPGLAVVVILILALGIGANTALYSLMNAMVFRTLPVRNPHELVSVTWYDQKGLRKIVHYDSFLELAKRQDVFESMSGNASAALTTERNGLWAADQVEAITSEYFSLFGLRPHLGRFFSSADTPQAGEPAQVVVVGYRFWRDRLGGDPDVIGHPINLDGTPLTVIGVMPRDFRGLFFDTGSDLFVPLSLLRRLASFAAVKRPVQVTYMIGRLRPGVSLEQANARLSTIWPAILDATLSPGLTPAEVEGNRLAHLKVESLARGFSTMRTLYTDPLVALTYLTALLLLIACANLSGLLLSRARSRYDQLGIYLALGAPRARLAQRQLVESLMLSVAGTIVALPFAWWAASLIVSFIWPPDAPMDISIAPDARVLALAGAVTIVSGLLVGMLPAWMATRRPHLRLQQGYTSGKSGWGRLLLTAQVALSLVLLFGAGLFVRNLAKLRNVDSGFNEATAKTILWSRLWTQPGVLPNRTDGAYYQALIERVSALHGVESAGFAFFFPSGFRVPIPSDPLAAESAGRSPAADGPVEVITPRFFETLSIPIMQGRDFSWTDGASSPAVAIINHTLAQKLFPSGNAIGSRIRVGREPRQRSFEIVGVVADLTVGDIRKAHQPVVFRPLLQEPRPMGNLIIRTKTGISGVGESVRHTLESMGRHYFRTDYLTLEHQVSVSLAQERVTALLSSFFGGLALLIAFVGLYGLLGHAVAQRTREIAVRMALGASRPRVIRMIVREGYVPVLIGTAIGLPCALGASRLIGSLLFALQPYDPVVLFVAALVFPVTGVIACLLPAMRASGINPATALRSD